MAAILNVSDLSTFFHTDAGVARAVDGVSFSIDAGHTMALVGESGCGKSVTALSIMRLIQEPPGRVESGSITMAGRDILALRPREMRSVRGNQISMIFQEPMTSLNPVFRVGRQVASVLRLHRKWSMHEAHTRTIELFRQVGIPSPEERVDDYPHQMSGGMRQRVMIAMALACDPALLIADEPTTALDVTIQAQILDLLRQLQKDRGMALLLITHDLGVVAEIADDVAVMYAGKIVEHAATSALFRNPSHPYTQGLFQSLPARARLSLSVSGKSKLHAIQGQVPAATDFPAGCRFHPRCPNAMPICRNQEPRLMSVSDNPEHQAACWLLAPENAS